MRLVPTLVSVTMESLRLSFPDPKSLFRRTTAFDLATAFTRGVGSGFSMMLDLRGESTSEFSAALLSCSLISGIASSSLEDRPEQVGEDGGDGKNECSERVRGSAPEASSAICVAERLCFIGFCLAPLVSIEWLRGSWRAGVSAVSKAAAAAAAAADEPVLAFSTRREERLSLIELAGAGEGLCAAGGAGAAGTSSERASESEAEIEAEERPASAEDWSAISSGTCADMSTDDRLSRPSMIGMLTTGVSGKSLAFEARLLGVEPVSDSMWCRCCVVAIPIGSGSGISFPRESANSASADVRMADDVGVSTSAMLYGCGDA
jgi:hypothetical protein